MARREFLKMIIAGGAQVFFSRTFAAQRLFVRQNPALPQPVVNTFSLENCLNSRLSYHSGYSNSLPDQILANILWACAKAPVIGAGRTIYVALADNVYQYDPAGHSLIVHQSGNHKSESGVAFEVGIASDLVEDAGTALHYGHIASIAFWKNTSGQPACCPKESATTNANNSWNPGKTIQMVNCYGLMGTVSGITTQLVAKSSNSTLPDPSTTGTVMLENALNTLKYGSQFSNTELILQEISQLAWASYGNTPHMATGKAGLTVASAVANYYLSGRIYIVRSEGVERYYIRQSSGQQTTRDHRIERVTAGDKRSQLRSGISRLPQTAPNYFIFCGTTQSGAQGDRWQTIEAGFAGSSALLQASSMNLQGFFTANFTSSEKTAIQNALGIPSADLPIFIFSAGPFETGINNKSPGGSVHIGASPNPFRRATQISCSASSAEPMLLTIFNAAGSLIRTLVDNKRLSGNFQITWDGTDLRGHSVPSGVYYYVLKIGTREYRQAITKL